MGIHKKTVELIRSAHHVLEEYHPMTLRQVFYRLVSLQVLKNTYGRYKALSRALVTARQEGMIPWDWIEDRLREPRQVAMWDDLSDFAEAAARAYRRDVWATQPRYLEVRLKKDALSGIFGQVLKRYGVTLNVGRGYDSWTSIHVAARRLDDHTTVLYFGDFDPSGEDMVRSLAERLAFFGCCPEIVKVALNLEDIERYDLPPDFTKASNSRRDAFVAKYGDVAVELDALPPNVLAQRLESAVSGRLDMGALESTWEQEKADGQQLLALLSAHKSSPTRDSENE